MTDQQLVSRMATGDAASFAAFYDRHAPRVLGLLCKLVGQRNTAEDVLQDTFFQAWRGAARYDPQRSSPAVWLMLMARSRAIDHLRRQRLAKRTPPVAEPALRSDPAEAIARSEATQQLRDALALLPEEQRSALCLAFYQGLTHEQVAAAQGVSLGTAKTRIRLGMRRLRSLLREPTEVSTS